MSRDCGTASSINIELRRGGVTTSVFAYTVYPQATEMFPHDLIFTFCTTPPFTTAITNWIGGSISSSENESCPIGPKLASESSEVS